MVRKIARTRSEAEVGEFLWRWDGNARMAGNIWSLRQVMKRGRDYVFVGFPGSHSRGWEAFRFDRGNPQPVNGYSPNCGAYGSQERQDREWKGKNYEMARLIERVDDIVTLKAIAHILGIETPKLHDTAPDEDQGEGG